MRAREIEKWLVKLLEHGATELADAEFARHTIRVFELVERMQLKMRSKEARNELIGWDDIPCEMAMSATILRARAEANEKTRLARQQAITDRASSPAAAPG